MIAEARGSSRDPRGNVDLGRVRRDGDGLDLAGVLIYRNI